MLVGIAADPDGKTVPRTPPPGGDGGSLQAGWAAGTPKMLYTIDIKTGAFRKIYTENDWTNHLQMSPTDPHLIMFCHEGPWHFNDRVWTIRTDGTGLRLMHERTMNMEIAGHEFFSADGKTVWYDLQTPQSTVFWLAGVDIATGHRTWYHLERNEWSVHFNVSADGKLFAGDGGGPSSVAARSPDGVTLNPPGNGQWIYLFRPVMVTREFVPRQEGPDRYRLLQVRASGESRPARLPSGAERHVFPGYEVGGLSFQHAWPHARLRGGDSEERSNRSLTRHSRNQTGPLF